MWGICSLAEGQLASQEVPCSVELVSYKNTLSVALVNRLAKTRREVLFKDAVNRCDYSVMGRTKYG